MKTSNTLRCKACDEPLTMIDGRNVCLDCLLLATLNGRYLTGADRERPPHIQRMIKLRCRMNETAFEIADSYHPTCNPKALLRKHALKIIRLMEELDNLIVSQDEPGTAVKRPGHDDKTRLESFQDTQQEAADYLAKHKHTRQQRKPASRSTVNRRMAAV